MNRGDCFSPGLPVKLASPNADSGRQRVKQPNYIVQRFAAEARLTSATFP